MPYSIVAAAILLGYLPALAADPAVTTSIAVLVTSLTVQGAEPKTGPNSPAAEKTYPTGLWRSELPTDCPFKPSASLTGIEFTGRHSDYRCGDTFYPSWASDGNLYSPWTAGKTDGMGCVTATYVPGLKKYLMCVTDGTKDTKNTKGMKIEYHTLSNLVIVL